jgi:hypothetical protein
MTIDQIIQNLIPTLRYTLLNPTDSAKAELLVELESVLGSSVGEPIVDQDRYYLHLIRGLIDKFISKPSMDLLSHISKISRHYLVLVDNGAVEVQRLARVQQFRSPSSNVDWFKQEIEDRAYAFINRPTEETKRNLEAQLKSYLELLVR